MSLPALPGTTPGRDLPTAHAVAGAAHYLGLGYMYRYSVFRLLVEVCSYWASSVEPQYSAARFIAAGWDPGSRKSLKHSLYLAIDSSSNGRRGLSSFD